MVNSYLHEILDAFIKLPKTTKKRNGISRYKLSEYVKNKRNKYSDAHMKKVLNKAISSGILVINKQTYSLSRDSKRKLYRDKISKTFLRKAGPVGISKKVCKTECRSDQLCNPNTKRCIKRDGVTGKRVLKELSGKQVNEISGDRSNQIRRISSIPGISQIIRDVNKCIKIPKYELLDWINVDDLTPEVSLNPKAIDFLKANPKFQNWDYLSENPNAINLLEKNPDKISREFLSKNPNAINLLEKDLDGVDWEDLSRNPNAISIMKDNPDLISWGSALRNPAIMELLDALPDIKLKILKYRPDKSYKPRTSHQQLATKMDTYKLSDLTILNLSFNPNAIELLKANPEIIDYNYLAANPNAIELLKDNTYLRSKFLNKNWMHLSANPNINKVLQTFDMEINIDKLWWPDISFNPGAINLLKANPDKIDWYGLSSNSNPEALDILKANPDKIVWDQLSANPLIFRNS